MARGLVLGAGAMGSVFAAWLTRSGHDITMLDIDRDHIDAVRTRGLELRHHDGRIEKVEVAATTDPSSLTEPEFVIVLTKSFDTTEAIAAVHTAIGPSTWVATVQNGLGNDTSLATVLGPRRVIPGTTTVGSLKVAPGVVEPSPMTTDGTSVTHLGPTRTPERDLSGARLVAGILSESGLPAEALDDADRVIWTKLVMAATAAPITAALGITVEDMIRRPPARAALDAMIDEVLAVARAEGVALDDDAVRAHCLSTYEAVGPHITSMAADVIAERRTEIEAMSIEIAARAEAHGLETPYSRVIGQMVKAIEAGYGAGSG